MVGQSCFADFFVFGPPLLLAQGAYSRIIRKMIVFSAPRLFSSQSPINLALQAGNVNVLQKRRRLHKKINRPRSPWSGTTFEHLPASRPPSFFIGHYLSWLFGALQIFKKQAKRPLLSAEGCHTPD
jgi:hypothetical protein